MKSSHQVISLTTEKNKAFLIFDKVQSAMRHVPDFVEACKEILDAVMEQTNAENCSLMLTDSVSGDLSIRAARGRNENRSSYYSEQYAGGIEFKAGEGIAGWVLKEGQAVMVNDVREEPRFVRTAGVNDRIRSLICFPIREHGRVVGVFNLSHSRKAAFNEDDKLALGYVSNQVGAALTSARFFLGIKEVNRLLKGSGEILRFPTRSSSTLIEVGEMSPGNGIFIYASEKMHRIKEIIDQVADTDVTVLIQGESGVGKEVVSRSIHLNSLRRDKPFIKVNCAALPHELLESELFGYEKGAFTGAYRQKPGRFELANGGTIFLDEIVEISPSLQAKLLQVLQDKEFSRLGGKADVKVDVRVLAATNKNIEAAVRNGLFREDLYYRLNVVNITIPPLKERREEIPIFVEYFLEKFGKKFDKKIKPLPDEIMKAFLRYHWPGNVRELENLIQRFVVLGNGDMLIDELNSSMDVSPPDERKEKVDFGSEKRMRRSLKEVQREAILKAEFDVIREALDLTHWNRKRAASMLNISYKALLYKIKECGVGKQSTSFPPDAAFK